MNKGVFEGGNTWKVGFRGVFPGYAWKSWVGIGESPNNIHSPYPTFAILEVSASDTCFFFSIVICLICSFSRPISSHNSLYRSSRSCNIARNISQTPSDVIGNSGNLGIAIARFERPFNSPGSNILPLPSRIQVALKLKFSHSKAIVSVPTFILPFRISENFEGLMPKISAIPALVSPLSCNRLFIAAINRLFISVFSIKFEL